VIVREEVHLANMFANEQNAVYINMAVSRDQNVGDISVLCGQCRSYKGFGDPGAVNLFGARRPSLFGAHATEKKMCNKKRKRKKVLQN
jgi:hypothetical protein